MAVTDKEGEMRTVAVLLRALKHAVADGHTGAARQHQQPPAAKLLVGLCHAMTTVTTLRTQVPTMGLSVSYDGQLHLEHVDHAENRYRPVRPPECCPNEQCC